MEVHIWKGVAIRIKTVRWGDITGDDSAELVDIYVHDEERKEEYKKGLIDVIKDKLSAKKKKR